MTSTTLHPCDTPQARNLLLSKPTPMTAHRPRPRSLDRFHALRVARIVAETVDARSIAFEVPSEMQEGFAYEPGQFVTLRATVGDEVALRSYSMSSAPTVDEHLQITVKRIDGGLVSNWLHDSVSEGDVLDVGLPAGGFVLTDSTDDIVCFAGGSGITPIYSITKAALHTTTRRVRLLFANQHAEAAIFSAALDTLADEFPGRLVVEQHHDDERGFVTTAMVAEFTGVDPLIEAYICGPGGFMDTVEVGLSEVGLDPSRIHIERFTSDPGDGLIDESFAGMIAAEAELTITLGRRTEKVQQKGATTILQSARWCGLPAQSSCETGHCAACMALVVEGEVAMRYNDALTADEIDEGWILTCQAVPVSPSVHVIYDP